MLSEYKVPTINSRYACIVDRDATSLAAAISSFLSVPGSYLPIFTFRKINEPRSEDPAFMSEAYVAYLMAEHDAVLIANALARIGQPEYLILAGLTEIQRSYLRLPKGSKLIEITDLSDIEKTLSPIAPSLKGELICKSSNLLDGLFTAQKARKKLVIDEASPALSEVTHCGSGIVVVENVSDVSSVIAVNYATAINASLVVVEPVSKDQQREIQTSLQRWKEKGDETQFQKLKDVAWARIGEISFSRFQYATFFTEGVPYGLIVENVLPCSHVHLSLRPDLFILNNIIFNSSGHIGAAVVFSPTFFEDEETSWLSEFLRSSNYYLRALTGKQATLANFDFHAQYFPYDILHVCSHGGEVDGYEMSEQFVDRDGNVHLAEWDEVLGVSPVPDKPDMVAVQRKVLPRKLDGFDWMSPQLREEKVPSHVILDMWKHMCESQGVRKKKDRIAMSCAIACIDSIHQGQFNTLASYGSPVIFNNTCWSWDEVAAFFLACGARGYIGTLWAVDNAAAVIAAKEFYKNLFGGSILDAFHRAIKAIENTPSKNIYIYWGLHFSKVAPGKTIGKARAVVYNELMHAAHAWLRKIEETKSAEVRSNSIKVLRSLLGELLSNFRSADVFRLDADIKRRVPDFAQRNVAGKDGQTGSAANQSSMDRTIEYRAIKG